MQVSSPLYEFLPYVFYKVADRRRIDDVRTPFFQAAGRPAVFSLALANRRLASQFF